MKDFNYWCMTEIKKEDYQYIISIAKCKGCYQAMYRGKYLAGSKTLEGLYSKLKVLK